mgnify:CR=1 FL=1
MNHSSHYTPQHRHILRLLFALVLSCVVVPSLAQVGEEAAQKMSDVDMDSPTFRPTVHTGKALVDGDSVQYVKTNNVYVFPKIEFKTPEECEILPPAIQYQESAADRQGVSPDRHRDL